MVLISQETSMCCFSIDNLLPKRLSFSGNCSSNGEGELNMQSFLHSLGLDHLYELFDREQVNGEVLL